MSVSNQTSPLPERCDWQCCWSALPAAEVESLAAVLTRNAEVMDLTLPQTGLALLQLQDSALNDPYYLGEIPMSKAQVRVRYPDGLAAEGAACLMDDRSALVHALAVLDAILSGELPGHDAAAELLLRGQQALKKVRGSRKQMLTQTRVDFTLLGAEDDD
ncbi:MAG: phosphonate C-P lyase system protein PhnG [Marinospirillum sp.]|uniref:phosphonate C-P lyase system protein PhnG n=1 Tax=Marinospirillum sp. TaxID=2183934 RepID=UPI0019E97062|nr:phosphonate C-P lyase system protein PhnG [Marinospirillum sp.]MBE0507199.1 phosphonate C-P lyase system protein PhnG [Marinospirillum sp.]